MKLDNIQLVIEKIQLSISNKTGEVLDSTSDSALAQIMLSAIEDAWPRSRCVSHCGTVYHYSAFDDTGAADGVWRVVPDEVLLAVMDVFDGFSVAGSRCFGLSSKKAAGILDRFKRIPSLVMGVDFFNDRPVGIAFENCFVSVTDKGIKTEPLDAKHKVRSKCPYPYFEEYDCPSWKKLLRTVFDCDDNAKQKHDIIQEFTGLALCGLATQYDKALILEGSGRNGKSTVIDSIKMLFPRDAVRSIPIQNWSNEYYIAQMDGLALNSVGESPSRRLFGSDVVKAVIAGDEVMGRHSYGRPFPIRPRAAHIMAFNELPETTDTSEGLWRRFIVLRFGRNMADLPQGQQMTRDEILRKIDAELPAIAHWALQGAVRVIQNGKYTEAEDDSLEEWRYESSSVPFFVKDALVEDPEARCGAADLHLVFLEWCQLAGYESLKQSTFGRRLVAMGVHRHRDAAGKFYRFQIKPKAEWSVSPTSGQRQADGWGSFSH